MGQAQTVFEEIDNMSLAGKYLTFVLDKEEYGIEILKVIEIIGLMAITTIPKTPKYIKGVINLRGKVIPVVDLRLKFEMLEVAQTSETCIIVVSVENVLIGVVVDTVSEVIDIVEADLEPAPQFGSTVDTDYILSMAKIDNSVKMLLNIESILSIEEIQNL